VSRIFWDSAHPCYLVYNLIVKNLKFGFWVGPSCPEYTDVSLCSEDLLPCEDNSGDILAKLNYSRDDAKYIVINLFLLQK